MGDGANRQLRIFAYSSSFRIPQIEVRSFAFRWATDFFYLEDTFENPRGGGGAGAGKGEVNVGIKMA
jgi:hypothetical protein